VLAVSCLEANPHASYRYSVINISLGIDISYACRDEVTVQLFCRHPPKDRRCIVLATDKKCAESSPFCEPKVWPLDAGTGRFIRRIR
jgi:hypothetical protein